MKLYKALKLKKKIIGEITKLKQQIKYKNSYIVGSLNAEKFNVHELYNQLASKIDQLIGLKYAINEANHEIQSKIYVLSESKALLSFLHEISVTEGLVNNGGFRDITEEYKVQIDEHERDEMVGKLQNKIDAIQEELDIYNYTTDIPWDEANA